MPAAELTDLGQLHSAEESISFSRRSVRILFYNSAARARTQTFITTQAQRLPFLVSYLAGNPGELDGQEVLGNGLWSRAWRRLLRELGAGRNSPNGLGPDQTIAIQRVLRRFKPHLILAQFGPSGALICRLAREHRIPLVVHFRGFDATTTSILDSCHDLYPPMFEYASRVIVVSRQMRDDVERLGCPSEKIEVNSSGVDVPDLPDRLPGSFPPASFIAVGRLVDKKAPHLTLLAFARVLDQLPEATLELVGDGPLRGVCSDIIACHGMEQAVRMRGYLPHDEVKSRMRASSTFVQHSVRALSGDCEGTPNSAMEACSVGVPVVATRHAGLVDVVNHGETGFLVAERDVRVMSEYMCKLAKEPELAIRMGNLARSKMLAEFSWDIKIARLTEILEDVLARRLSL